MSVFDKMRGKKPPERKKQVSEMSDEELANYTEEGIEEGDLEDVVPYGSTLSMLTPLGGAKKALRKGAKEVAEHAPGIIRKLEQKAAPLFSDAVEAGATKPGAKSFAKFIRGGEEVVENAPKKKLETLKVPRFSTGNEKLKALQAERESLNLKTPEGRDRLKEIDHMLENRTYFDN